MLHHPRSALPSRFGLEGSSTVDTVAVGLWLVRGTEKVPVKKEGVNQRVASLFVAAGPRVPPLPHLIQPTNHSTYLCRSCRGSNFRAHKKKVSTISDHS